MTLQISPSDISRLCIVCPTWVGDTVMATPVFRAIRAHLPEVRLSAVMKPGLDQVLDGNPWLDAMAVAGGRGIRGAIALAGAIRTQQPDTVLLLTNSFRTALAARLSGSRWRIGYDRDGRGWLLTHRLPPPPRSRPTPAVSYYAHLAREVFDLDASDESPQLFVTDAAQRNADAMLAGVDRPFALFNPGASKAAKRWPAERFAALADRVHDELQLDIVMTGSPAESPLLIEIGRTSRVPIVNLAERNITLSSLKVVAARAAVMVTNDTGPRHIAAALGTPIVTLFGPTDPRWTTLPGVIERRVVAEPFLPDDLVADDHPKACDIERIRVGDVVQAMHVLLAREAVS